MLILNTVPLPATPPPEHVPYKVSPDRIKGPTGVVPSAPLKLCKVVKVCTIAELPKIEPTLASINSSSKEFLMDALIEISSAGHTKNSMKNADIGLVRKSPTPWPPE